jgi:hypothetical protein
MEEQWKWVGLALAAIFLALAGFTIITLDFVGQIVFSISDWLIDRDWFEYLPIPIALAWAPPTLLHGACHARWGSLMRRVR